MKRTVILLSAIIAILACMVVTLQIQLQNSEQKRRTARAELRQAKSIDHAKDLVYSVCNISRTTSDLSEQTCGELQDYYKMEYICKERNNSALNQCWVEYKN